MSQKHSSFAKNVAETSENLSPTGEKLDINGDGSPHAELELSGRYSELSSDLLVLELCLENAERCWHHLDRNEVIDYINDAYIKVQKMKEKYVR